MSAIAGASETIGWSALFGVVDSPTREATMPTATHRISRGDQYLADAASEALECLKSSPDDVLSRLAPEARDVVSEASNSVSERSERRGAGGNRTLVR